MPAIDIRGTCHLPLSLRLEYGGEIVGAHIDYELHGAAGAPVILVLGGISANRHVAACSSNPSPGWFDPLVGSGRAIDTDHFRVLGVEYLVADEPAPAISTRDHAIAIGHVLDHLDLDILHAVCGASLGGMVALQLGTAAIARTERVLAISAADRPDPRASAWRGIQRDVVRELWSTGRARRGLELARALAMTTYRTPEELADRFDGGPAVIEGCVRTPVQAYLDARGTAFAESFTAERFLALSQSLDLHRVIASDLTAPTTLIGVRSDPLVRIEQLRQLCATVERSGRATCRLHEFDSWFGHDAFLKDGPAIAPWIRSALLSDAERPRDIRLAAAEAAR